MKQINKNLIIKYFIITYVITWFFWGLRAFLTTKNIININDPITLILFSLGSLGPTTASIILLDDKSLNSIKNYIFNHKKNSIIYFLLFTVLYSVAFYCSSFKLVEGTTIITIIETFIITLLVQGGNEELGWRGILTEEINKKFNPLVTSLIISVPWAIWHIPLWFAKGDMHQSVPYVTFCASIVLLSIVLGAIKNRTYSVFYCMLMHAVFNILSTYILYEFNIVLILGFIINLGLAIYFSLNNKKIESNC